jgi:hypothetical protein
MQLPSVDRTPEMRHAGADLATAGANRVIPVAPVNPGVHASPPLVPAPGVIDMVNPALKKTEGEPVYTSVSDPARRGSEAATAPKDWTIHRPAPEQAQAQPQPAKPLAQVLMDHLKTVWTASASAVQMEQVQNQMRPPVHTTPTEVPGMVAKEVLTYAPNKIKKNEKI